MKNKIRIQIILIDNHEIRSHYKTYIFFINRLTLVCNAEMRSKSFWELLSHDFFFFFFFER
jgi:hypothetical protein